MTVEEQLEIERQERLEYENVIKSIQVIMSRPEGKKFLKYLLNSLDFGAFPPVGLYGEQLIEHTAFLRAGNTIYKMILEASPELTGQLITEIEKDRQDAEKKRYANESNGR